MKSIRARFGIAALFAVASSAAIAQGVAASGETPGPENPSASSVPAFVLRAVSYSIEGRTREYYLARAADFEIGMTFADRAALDAYLEDRRQLIVNERVIETVEIEATIGGAGAGGPAPVD